MVKHVAVVKSQARGLVERALAGDLEKEAFVAAFYDLGLVDLGQALPKYAHLVMHFLDDCDIRKADLEYDVRLRAAIEREMNEDPFLSS